MTKFHRFTCITFTLLILLLSHAGNSQVYSGDKKYLVETSGMIGWMFSFGNYNSRVVNNPLYSFSAAYIKDEQKMYEFSVNTIASHIIYKNYNGHSDTTARYSQTYYMIGIVKTFRIDNPKFQPFFSTSIGFINRSVQIAQASPQTQLAVGLQGGIKYFIKDQYGIKVQARLQSSLDGFGLGVGFGTAGPSVGLGSYSNSVQVDFSGGVFYRF